MKKYLKTADSNWYKHRIIGVIFCVLAAFAILFIRLFFLQVIKGRELSRLSENNSIRLQDISPSRGLICDRNGKVLVDNRPDYVVSIILKDAEPIEMTLNKLAHLIPTGIDELLAKVEGKKGISRYVPIVLKQDIGREALAAVEVHKYDLPGIVVNVKPRRNYLYQKRASHLLGYLGEISPDELKNDNYSDYRKGDLIGKFGAERVYEKYTRGIRGGRQVEVNATGQVVKILKTVDAHPGHNVFLTIDWELQSKAEELLEGVTGAAVALDPSNGQVLALASSPSFDQNTFVGGISHEQWNAYISDPLKPFTNRAVQGEYPPGSTYKVITAIAGLEEGIVDKNTKFESCVGFYKYKNREYGCWKKGGHGKLALVDSIIESCDVYFYQLGMELGVDKLADYAKASGLGVPTGIDLDREAGGLIPTAEWKKRRFDLEWQKGETLSLSIGQSFNLTTPIQMAVLVSAIANGGVRYRPEILKKIEAAEGSLLRENKPKIMGYLPASQVTLELVKEGLWGVLNTDKGTARGSRIMGIEYSGKTGTAEIVSRKEDEENIEEEKFLPDHLKPHAWFIAYAPSESPEIAVSVVVENGEHGSGAAAPLARELIKTYLKDKNTIQ